MRTLILIDDDKDWSLDIKEFLELKNYKVDHFEKPEQGLEKIKSNIYDILIIDYKLLNGVKELDNGIKVLNKVREFDKLLPVILVSGQIEKSAGDVEDVYLGAIHLGIADYFKKAPGAKALYEMVKKVELEKTDSTYETFKRWFNNTSDKNKELFYSTKGDQFTIRKIVDEVRKGTEFGKEIKDQLNEFSLNLLNRKK